MKIYDGESSSDDINEQPWRFEDIGVSDRDLEWVSEQEQRHLALDKIKTIAKEYIDKLVQGWKVPNKSLYFKVHAEDSPQEILAKAQKLKQLADTNQYEQFVAEASLWTGNTKATMLADMMKQLKADDSEDLLKKVKELKVTNDQYEWVDSFRKAFKMIKINKIKKNLAKALEEDPKKAMRKMIGYSTNIVSNKLGIKRLGFHLRNKNRIVYTTQHIAKKRIEDVQWVVSSMKEDFPEYPSMHDLFVKVGNEYLKTQSILWEIK